MSKCGGPEGRQEIAPTVRSGFERRQNPWQARRVGTGSALDPCAGPPDLWRATSSLEIPDLTVRAITWRPFGPLREAQAARLNAFWKKLEAKGLVAKRKPVPSTSATPFQPIQVQGKPLSEVIVEERR